MIEAEINVRPARPTGPILLLIFGLALNALSLIPITAYLRGNEPIETLYYWIPVALVGLLLCLASVVWWIGELLRRRWLTITPEGFFLRAKDTLTYVMDEQILSTASTSKPMHFNGWWRSTMRTLHIWIAQTADDHTKLTLVYKIPHEASDPLAELTERINHKLAVQAKTELESGQIVFGEGWALDQRILRVTPRKKAPIEVPVAELESVDLIDEELCIWIEGRDEPLAKIPIGAANALILQALVTDWLGTKMTEPELPDAGRLGRIVFQRRPTTKEVATYLVVGVIFAMLVPVLMTNGWNTTTYYMVGGMLFAAVLFLGIACNAGIAFFRCHHWGVHRRWIFSDKKLLFSEMESLTFSAIQQFNHGVYTGTFYTIVFDPIPAEKSKRIFYWFIREAPDLEMEKLRDKVSRLIAAKMLAKIHQGQCIPWTNTVSLRLDGLEFETTSLLLRKQTTLLPYEDITRHDLCNGSLHLFSKENPSAVLKMDMKLCNFYPGLMALEILRAGRPVGD